MPLLLARTYGLATPYKRDHFNKVKNVFVAANFLQLDKQAVAPVVYGLLATALLLPHVGLGATLFSY